MGAAVTSACSNCKERISLEMSYVPHEGEADQDQEFMVEACDHERRQAWSEEDANDANCHREGSGASVAWFKHIKPVPVLASSPSGRGLPGLRSEVDLGIVTDAGL
eukprot:gb/GFBE01002793.1/.p1 GENE.gb/GFBE01002793.1/~~gb/GFBE01002793.1/.p1  ORF type:complete len:106 (+),score=12.11 gb/GFBE01002793.1/:1-318(+)